jgi:hypothetical protein
MIFLASQESGVIFGWPDLSYTFGRGQHVPMRCPIGTRNEFTPQHNREAVQLLELAVA